MQEGSQDTGGTSKGKGGSTGRERFSTPASWEGEKSQQLGGLGLQTEGEMPAEGQAGTPSGVSVPEDEGLQRALEKEVVAKLHQENLRLKFEMEQLRQQQEKVTSSSTELSWSEVSQEVGVPPPPPARSRSPTRRSMDVRQARFTPQGTRVPDTPPPGVTTGIHRYHHGRGDWMGMRSVKWMVRV